MLVSHKQIFGALASCVVQQHPFNSTDGVDTAIRLFFARIEAEAVDTQPGEDEYGKWFNMDSSFYLCKFKDHKHLYDFIYDVLYDSPVVAMWNSPIRGNHKMMMTSRHFSPKPEYDFIDIDALIGNIAAAITLECDAIDKEWAEDTKHGDVDLKSLENRICVSADGSFAVAVKITTKSGVFDQTLDTTLYAVLYDLTTGVQILGNQGGSDSHLHKISQTTVAQGSSGEPTVLIGDFIVLPEYTGMVIASRHYHRIANQIQHMQTLSSWVRKLESFPSETEE